jgi:hypothetical protein
MKYDWAKHYQERCTQLMYDMARQQGLDAETLAPLLGPELYAAAALLLMKVAKP